MFHDLVGMYSGFTPTFVKRYAEAGTAIYLPEGTKHAVRTGPDESVTILWVFDEGDSERITTTWLE